LLHRLPSTFDQSHGIDAGKRAFGYCLRTDFLVTS
jgi:hypothetical protein